VGVVQEGDVGRPVRVVLHSGHLGGHPVFIPFEIDQTQTPLVPPAPMADGDAAGIVPSGVIFSGRQQSLFRLLLGDLGELVHHHLAPPGRCGLIPLNRHCKPSRTLPRTRIGSCAAESKLSGPQPANFDSRFPYKPSKISIRLPGAKVTTAFFRSGRRPSKRPMRRSFPRIRIVFTSTTFTLKSFSMALRISILLASGATSKTYLFSAIISVLFSVTMGRMIASVGSTAEHLPHF